MVCSVYYAASAGVYVISPETLSNTFQDAYGTAGLPNTLANFGNPPYGSAILGQLHYFGEPGAPSYACTPLPFLPPPSSNVIRGPVVVLIDRGSCSFVQKVRHA
jgi:hypothetical protein